jgi:hypothetical protein
MDITGITRLDAACDVQLSCMAAQISVSINLSLGLRDRGDVRGA